MRGPGCAAGSWEMVCQQFQETLGLGLFRVDGPRTLFPQASASAGFLSSPGSQPWGQRQASAVLICFKCNTEVTTLPTSQKVVAHLLPARWGSFGGSEGPGPSCDRTKALRNPPAEVAAAAKGHLGHSLEDGAHVLCSQAEHWTETLHPNGPPLPSPGPSGRSQAPVLSRSFFTSYISLRRSILQPTTVMDTSLRK